MSDSYEPPDIDAGTRSTHTIKQMRWTLADLKDIQPETGIRLRIKGQGWQSVFHKLIHVLDSHVVFLDEKNNHLRFITLVEAVQFSINQAFQKLCPNLHYHVATHS